MGITKKWTSLGYPLYVSIDSLRFFSAGRLINYHREAAKTNKSRQTMPLGTWTFVESLSLPSVWWKGDRRSHFRRTENQKPNLVRQPQNCNNKYKHHPSDTIRIRIRIGFQFLRPSIVARLGPWILVTGFSTVSFVQLKRYYCVLRCAMNDKLAVNCNWGLKV